MPSSPKTSTTTSRPQQLTLALDAAPRAPADVTSGPESAAGVASVPGSSAQGSSVPQSRLLERALRAELGAATRVVITDNRSTLLSHSERRGELTVRVHQMFIGGGEEIFEAIARYLKSGHAGAGRRIDAYVEQHRHLLEHHASELAANAHVGKHHDLQVVFRGVNRVYFDPEVAADITWGQHGSARRRSRSSITLGSYDERARRITIHPALDAARVPGICVASVVHHEMLHAVIGSERGPGGRRLVHGPRFRAEEATFEGAKEANAWFDANLDTLLRYRRPRSSR